MTFEFARIRATATGFLTAAAVVAGLGLPQAIAQSGEPVKIGAISLLTGKFASYGKDIEKGLVLAEKWINANGGILDRPLEIVIEDDGSEPAQTITILRRFGADSSLVGMIGPVGTPNMLAAVPVMKQLSMPTVSISTNPMTLEEFPACVVRVSVIENAPLFATMLEQLAEKKNVKTLAILTERTSNYGQTSAKTLREVVAGNDAHKIVAEESFAAGDQDFAAILDKVMSAKPDAIWIAGSVNEAVLILQQARARKFEGVFVGGSGLADPKIPQLAKADATGLVTLLPMDMVADIPVLKEFIKLHEEQFGPGTISTQTAHAFDSVLVMANAIENASAPDREAICEALGATKGFQGVETLYSFEGKGDNTTPQPFIVEVDENGALVAIK